jgi:FtsP/CotA-like multicopper oxidase with cupredoxin domain
MAKLRFYVTLLFANLILVLVVANGSSSSAGVIDDAADLPTQQAQEKEELKDMHQELNDIKSTINEAQHGAEQVRRNMSNSATMQEVHLIAKETIWEPLPGVSTTILSYNGQEPGPVIRVLEGQPVRIILHNQMRMPTSLCFHGMMLPHAVAGLPRRDAGLVNPGQTYAFQLVAPAAGTYWYHPQVIHGDQLGLGLYGALIVEPVRSPQAFEHEEILMLGQTVSAGKTYFTVNGKSAPAIPPIEVKQNERVRLRVVNASANACPLYLTGHHFEVVGCNGSDALEPHVTRDTITLQPGDRYDLEFTANNPGVWSLASILPSQTNNDGRYPGGIAVVVRYPDALQ